MFFQEREQDSAERADLALRRRQIGDGHWRRSGLMSDTSSSGPDESAGTHRFFEEHDGPRFLPGQIPHEVPASPARPPGRLLAAGAQLFEHASTVIRHASAVAATGRGAS
jgi:hypothetical protein